MKSTVYLVILLALMMLLAACDDKTTAQALLSAPVISPESGTYDSGTEVTITSTDDDVLIYYTINGSDPTETSNIYSIPLSIPTIFHIGANNGIVKARAYKEGFAPSAITEMHYAINYTESVATPDITPASDSLVIGNNVTITCPTAGSQIRYTLDGSNPSINSPVYSTPVRIMKQGLVTVKAMAFRASMNPSAVDSMTYVVTYTAPTMIDVPTGMLNYNGSEITISGFKMGSYEVSQVGYAAVMGVTPSYFSADINSPVERVSWFNAVEYCNRRSIQEELDPCYSYSSYGTNPDDWPEGWDVSKSNHELVACNFAATGYRLPTEMEWMYAANAATADTLATAYSGGNDVDAVAWYTTNSANTSHSVGTKAANALGIYDLSGNVWEWCWDIHGDYPTGNQNNPSGPTTGSYRIFRGGSWHSSYPNCKIDYRNWGGAPVQYYDLGFRVVRK